MLYQPNYTTEGAAPPKVQPSPDKVREMVARYNTSTLGDDLEKVAGFLAFLGDPFACVASFEFINELGMSDRNREMYKEAFVEVLVALGLEIEWENEYSLKKEDGVIYALYEGKKYQLYTEGVTFASSLALVERSLRVMNFNVNMEMVDIVSTRGRQIIDFIEEEGLY